MAIHGREWRGDEPAVDDRLVMPGSGIEILEGRVLKVPGADPPHATEHAELAYVLRAHVAPGHLVAVDMLTRTSRESDFAPDVSVFESAPDPATGGRRIEALALEVVASQRLGVAARKARELSRRGVRRIVCIVLATKSALEWDRERERYVPLPATADLADASLARPVPVAALLDAARADAAVWRALDERRPDLRRAVEAAEARRALEVVCDELGIEVPPSERAGVSAMDADELRALLRVIVRAGRWPAG